MAEPSSDLTHLFGQRFPDAASPRLAQAPGRVNLIGEHTDYNLGFVCPIAIGLHCTIAFAPNRDGMLRLYSENEAERWEWPLDQVLQAKPEDDWTDYVVGVAQQLHKAGLQPQATDMLISSTVPVGSGLSSSAALEVASALALLHGRPIERLQLAQLCQQAEREFVGVPVGIMDQYVSAMGEAGSALRIDCRSLQHELIPLPQQVSVLACNTMVKHELGSSAYAMRVRECAEAAQLLGVASLRDVDSERVRAARGLLPDVVYGRALHIATENERVQAFGKACRASDLPAMGQLFVASHRSLQQDYEVSCEELDFLVDTAITLPGCYGARMTGGGFGGCIVALVEPAREDSFQRSLRQAYQQRYHIEAPVYVCQPSPGAGLLA